MNDTLSAALTFSMLSTVYIKEYLLENREIFLKIKMFCMFWLITQTPHTSPIDIKKTLYLKLPLQNNKDGRSFIIWRLRDSGSGLQKCC